MKKVFIAASLVIVWMGMIFILSEMNSNESNNKSKVIVEKIIGEKNTKNDVYVMQEIDEDTLDNANFIFRKFAHTTVYLVLSFFVCNFFYQLKKKKFSNNYLVSIIICFLYAISDEYHQTFVVGRTGNYRDVIIDLIGSIMGGIIFHFLVKTISKNKTLITES